MKKFSLSEYVLSPKGARLKKAGKNGISIFYALLRMAILLAVGFIVIYPLFYMIVTSIQSRYSFMNSTKVWIPNDFAIIENFKVAVDLLEYGRAFFSTFKYELVSAGIQIVSCAIAAYGFARFNFKLKKIYTALLFLTILVPDMMILMPRMANYSQLDILGIFGLLYKLTGIDLRVNILDSVLAFWLPSFLGVGLKSGILIYIYIQFFKGLPHELEEAAWVDGAGPVRTFVSIAVPSSSVVFITVSVLSLIWHWNDTLLPSMYLTGDYPLANMLKDISAALSTKYNLLVSSRDPESMAYMMASCVIFVAPVLIFYMIVQRWFIESIDRVGITG